jgi:hypothetical protein
MTSFEFVKKKKKFKMSASKSLFECQKKALISMLNLNQSSSSAEPDQIIWKIVSIHLLTPPQLIYDNPSQQIISPVLKVNDLRRNGVTVNLNINTPNRLPIPDVPAVYFLAPTEENVRKLSNDWALGLYSQYYVNFNAPISRGLLENLAKAAADCPVRPGMKQ